VVAPTSAGTGSALRQAPGTGAGAANMEDRLGEIIVGGAAGRGVTRVWEHPGPPGAPTLMLVHGVTMTAALNWSGVQESLGRQFRVISMDLCGHGERFPPVGGFSLEDCTDDLALLARICDVSQLIAVGYSMGGLIAQLLYQRHQSLVRGLVLCSTARNFRGSSFEKLAAVWLPTLMATMRWNPIYPTLGSELLGASLIGDAPDRQTRSWARGQMNQTKLTTALEAIQAVSDFTSHDWASSIDVPTAVIVPTRDRVVPPVRQHKLAAAIPGAAIYDFDGDHGAFLNDPETLSVILLAATTRLVSGGVSQAPGP
jgi:pimeloyl-ACP methyl ester carboxylesterase